MVIIENLDKLTSQIETIFQKQKLIFPKCGKIGKSHPHKSITEMLSLCQDLYNQIELGFELLGAKVTWGEPTLDEKQSDYQFFTKLISDLMGRYSNIKLSYKVTQTTYTTEECDFEWQRVGPAIGGICTVIQLLTEALGFSPSNITFAELLPTAYNSFQKTAGAIERLKSRLNWQVMYPDTLSKDSMQLQKQMMKHGFDEVWSEFQAGLDNYRQNHLLDSTNRFANATTLLLSAIARKYKFKEGQLGAHTIYLEKLGFIHLRIREMISQYWGYLAKFRKGNEPTSNEAMLLLDLAFSIFGFLLPRLDEFKVEEDMLQKARKDTKKIIKMRKEEDARRLVKAEDK